MAKGYLSNRQKNLKIGISSYTENNTVLEVAGKVGIGTTNATSNLHIVGKTSTTSLVVSAGATINGLTYPTSDGSYNQVLATDGAGVVRFVAVPGLGGIINWEDSLDFGLVTQDTTTTSDLNLITDPVSDDYDLGSLSIPELIFDQNQDLGSITVNYSYINDFGLITDSVTSTYDFEFFATGGLVYPEQFVLPSFTVASLPSVNPAGQMLFVTDETGGSIPAFSDGVNWRRLSDRVIVS